MAPDALKRRARRLVEEVLNQGDLAVADELLAPDCVHHVVDDAHPPQVPGPEGMKRWVIALRRAFPDLWASVDDEIAEADRVVQRLTCRGTHQAPLLGIPPTGGRITVRAVGITRCGPDGRFVETWYAVDRLGLLEQLGARPRRAGGASGGEQGRGTG